MRKFNVVALAYDFDGTLAPGNMQEHSFLPDIGMSPKEFWDLADELAKKHEADRILTYMNLMLTKAKSAEVPVRRVDLINHGKSIKLYPGVETWFNSVNRYGKSLGLKVEHYIISSGLREMIEGTPISHEFEKIYASSFKYDSNDVAEWPATALNFTTKTQYLFRINKGALDISDDTKINKFLLMKNRPIPFSRILFIGDGETDIPCFSLVKSLGGHSIAVYKQKTKGANKIAQQLIKDGRVNFTAKANYSGKSEIMNIVKAILTKIARDCDLEYLGKQN